MHCVAWNKKTHFTPTSTKRLCASSSMLHQSLVMEYNKSPRPIRPVHNPTLEKIDTAAISNVMELEFCSKYVFEINLTILWYEILEKLVTFIFCTSSVFGSRFCLLLKMFKLISGLKVWTPSWTRNNVKQSWPSQHLSTSRFRQSWSLDLTEREKLSLLDKPSRWFWIRYRE